MKKIAALLMVGIILLSCVAVLATGGSSTDPLVSLSYITNTYLADITTQADTRIDTTTQTTYQSALDSLESLQSDYLEQATELSGGATVLSDCRVKKNDVITMEVGASVMLLAGDAVVTTSAGGVLVDVTSGQSISSGSALTATHRYIVGEGGEAALSITSDTAVVALAGTSEYLSSTQVDYNALADALKEMGMFNGGDVSYGSGYELERAPTRIEALIMFLRMMGEESAALSYTGECPFVDVPDWCKSYTGYAYAMGYTKGVGTDASGQLMFGTTNTSSATEYVTFIMRALGYSDSGDVSDFDWFTTLTKATEYGVLTTQEYQMLSEGDFLRAQVVYLSYYALTTPMKGSSETLLASLNAKGTVNATMIQLIMNGVTVSRLS